MPTSYEPVKAMPSIPSFVRSSSPTLEPGPATRLNTPGGKPAFTKQLAKKYALTGDSDAGLATTVLPAMSEAEVMPVSSASGKFHGAMTPKTPYGSSSDW